MMWRRAKSRNIIVDTAVGTSFQVSKAVHPSGTILMVKPTATSGTFTINLPAANGDNWEGSIVVRTAVPSGAIVVIKSAGGFFRGLVSTMASGTGVDTVFSGSAVATANTLTLAPATTGGASVGERVDLTDLDSGTPIWLVSGQLAATTPATPFSNT